ncbi:MAG: response regulator [Ignavibacteria bacterium]|nr:MAG: response regulator [Ignavibacteria bacterium]
MKSVKFLSPDSARTKIVLISGTVLAAICIATFFYLSSRFRNDALSLETENFRRITEVSGEYLKLALTFDELVTDAMDQTLERIKENPYVKYAVIEQDSPGVNQAFNIAQARQWVYQDIQRGDPLSAAVYKVRMPVVLKDSPFGTLYLGFSLDRLQAEMHQTTTTLVLVCAVAWLFGLVIIFLLAWFFTHPISALAEVAERAAKGDWRVGRIPPPVSNNEIGRAGRALHAAIMNAESGQRRLETLTGLLNKRDQQLSEEQSQRKMIEKQVQVSDDIIKKTSALILVADSTGGIQYASPSFSHVLGYEPETLLQDGWWSVGKRDAADAVERKKERNRVAKCARRELPISSLPYERQSIDSQENPRWILWQETAGVNNTLIVVGQDITQRKQAEEQIREQAALLDITGDAILVRNLEHQILYWNRGAENLYGLPQQQVLERKMSDILEEEDSGGIEKAYFSVMNQGAWSGEMKQVTKAGKKLVVESRWTLMNDAEGKARSILIVNTDVTEQRDLEVQFRRAQRLENIGTLAGGIAHDLNNVLSPILMSIQALQRRHSDDKTLQLLSTIDLSARRGADIVKQVLTFARGTEGERILLQPKHILREIEKITRETFPRSIEIQFDLPNDLWTITGDATQLHQIILNLLVNARDAMPEGGTLTMKGENVSLDEQTARFYLNAKPGNYVLLSIMDSGTGISPDILEKIFDPFFTTKEVGKGTGLGLSTVSTIVKSYGGFITVDSTVGKGSIFEVYIPATNAEVSPQKKEESRRELPVGRGESVLIVDDELSIREITKETLEAYGYRTATAKDGIEALTIIEKDRHKFSLVLTDMMMPNMDGASLIRTLRRLTPDIKVIAVSGATDQDVLEKVKKSHVEAFLPKPIQAENLLRLLDTILHGDGKTEEPRRAHSRV